MVTSVKESSPILQIRPQYRILELAGPAGAGKSTIARALCQQSNQFSIGQEIAFRNLKQLPILVDSSPLWMSTFFALVPNFREWTWDEIKFLVYLRKWDRVLEQQASSQAGTVLLDHGPIFKMATLHAFGPAWLRTEHAADWWQALFQKWASCLDLIVWLDAPDAFLETRINARNQKHQVKGKTGQEVTNFMSEYRSSYSFIMTGLAAANGPAVLWFDTSRDSLNEIVTNILAACILKETQSR
jgi:deoxyadenosine/deoxycytidine kinase